MAGGVAGTRRRGSRHVARRFGEGLAMRHPSQQYSAQRVSFADEASPLSYAGIFADAAPGRLRVIDNAPIAR